VANYFVFGLLNLAYALFRNSFQIWAKIFKHKEILYGIGDSLWGIVFVEKETLNDRNYEKLEKLPPSAKLVFKTLEAKGQMTQKDIIRETILPPRTVRYAISRLKKENVLTERFYFIDSRQSLYDIKRHVNQIQSI
jgi:hypothetical protein